MQDEGEYYDHSVGEREIQATMYAIVVAVAISIVVVEIGSSSGGVSIEEGTPFRMDGQLQQLAQKQQKPDAWKYKRRF
jgi:hypothetical protein